MSSLLQRLRALYCADYRRAQFVDRFKCQAEGRTLVQREASQVSCGYVCVCACGCLLLLFSWGTLFWGWLNSKTEKKEAPQMGVGVLLVSL